MSHNELTYGVMAATSQLGGHVVQQLLQHVQPSQIVAVVRNAAKAEALLVEGVTVRVADYEDSAALDAALKGVDKLLLISTNDLSGGRIAQHQNVIDAAKRNGVQRIAYTSVLNVDDTTNPVAPDHKATEQAITESGVAHTFLRHGWYTENYANTIDTAKATGSVMTSAGNGKVSSATRADYAAADVAALVSDDGNRVYELAGDSAWDFAQLAQTLSTIVGSDVTVQNVSANDRKQSLIANGLPAGMAEFTVNVDQAIANGELENNDKQISKLIGRPTTSLIDGLQQ